MIENMYASAYQHWRSIKPIRGRAEDTRPFLRRSRTHEQIRLNERSGDIEFVLYGTACLIVHRDDSFSLQHGGWVTSSTGSFLAYVFKHMGWLRKGGCSGTKYISSPGVVLFFKEANNLWMVQQNRASCDTIAERKELYIRVPIGKTPTRFVWDEEKNLYANTTPVRATKTLRRTDKEQSKQVLERLKEFRKYVAVMDKLMNGEKFGRDVTGQYFNQYLAYRLVGGGGDELLGSVIREHMESSDTDKWLTVLVNMHTGYWWNEEHPDNHRRPTLRLKRRVDATIKQIYGLTYKENKEVEVTL